LGVVHAARARLTALDFSSSAATPSAAGAAVDALLAVLRAHPAHAASPQDCTLHALYSICVNLHAAAHAAAAGALDAAVRAMRGHPAGKPCVLGGGCMIMFGIFFKLALITSRRRR
jgi:hypothetical protein